jgi:hypothetical protein
MRLRSGMAATAAMILALVIAGGTFSVDRSNHGGRTGHSLRFTQFRIHNSQLPTPRGIHLTQLVGATARLVAVALVPLNDTSLRSAVQDFVAVQEQAAVERARLLFRGGRRNPYPQLPTPTIRLTIWRPRP